jgi:hypothetical protein
MGSPLEEKHCVNARIYFLQCVTNQKPQPRTDDLKLWGEKDRGGKRKPGVWVSTCLNVLRVNEKHQFQIHWLLEQLKRDLCIL